MVQRIWLLGFILGLNRVLGFDNTRNDNLAIYWGQDSYGATHSDTANFQKTLSFYCADNTIDVFPLAFLDQFSSTGGVPHIDFSNICGSTASVFPGTNLANCQFLASDIQGCQAKGKIVTLSMGGGAAGSGVTFSSASQATSFGDQIWDLFLGGSSTTRPFGAAVLDGIDLDIEGGSTTFFDSFVNQIRARAAGASKKYYITAAPQCPFPDAYLGTVLNAVAFDAVYVQFYNNYCSLPNFNNPQDWDFGTWDNWVKTTAVNKNMKVYIGAPGSTTAAGSGYVDAATLGNIIQQTRSQYSTFGGVMMWDASQAYANNRYDAAVKSFLTNGGGTVSPSPTATVSTSSVPTSTSPAPPATTSVSKPISTTTPPAPTSSTPVSTPSSSAPASSTAPVGGANCAGVAPWSSTVAYVGGQQVTSNGHLWTAKWWSEADVPGGVAGDWTDDGPCMPGTAVRMTAVSQAATPTKASNSSAPKASTPNQASALVQSPPAPAVKTAHATPIGVSNGTATQALSNATTTHKSSRLFRLRN